LPRTNDSVRLIIAENGSSPTRTWGANQDYDVQGNKMAISYGENPPTVREYNQLRKHVGWGVYTDTDAVAYGLEHSLFHVTVRDGDTLIGMGRVIGDGAITFYIQDVIVLEGHRGQGLGKAIMERIMTYIARTATEGAVVGLFAAKGKDAFYERFDFIARPNESLGKGMMQLWLREKS
jgi:GNAT superfamily N-acetyltransferase